VEWDEVKIDQEGNPRLARNARRRKGIEIVDNPCIAGAGR
jgi:hypothetical protein